MKLKFIHKQKIANDSWDLAFEKPEGFAYEPGQYLEINLDHPNPDDRGTTRWFTMSSSPTEGDLMLTTRLVERHSSFKQALFGLKAGDSVEVKGPMGKFLLPQDSSVPLVWIAGGIGITPFRSQLKFIIDNEESRDITLIYSNRTKGDICFDELWQQASEKLAKFKLISTLVDEIPQGWHGETGMVDEAMIKKAVGQLGGKQYFISGPEPMVEAFKPKLVAMGIADTAIHQDWFPNYTEEFFKVN